MGAMPVPGPIMIIGLDVCAGCVCETRGYIRGDETEL